MPPLLGLPKGPKTEKIQSRLKFSISLENVNPDLQNSTRRKGVWWVACLKFSISLENFKILKFFSLWALRELSLDCDRPFLRKEVGVAATVCNNPRNTVRQGYSYACLVIGGVFGRVTKMVTGSCIGSPTPFPPPVPQKTLTSLNEESRLLHFPFF